MSKKSRREAKAAKAAKKLTRKEKLESERNIVEVEEPIVEGATYYTEQKGIQGFIDKRGLKCF